LHFHFYFQLQHLTLFAGHLSALSKFHQMRSKYLVDLPSNRNTFSLQSSRSGDWICPRTVVGRIPVRKRKVKDTKKVKNVLTRGISFEHKGSLRYDPNIKSERKNEKAS